MSAAVACASYTHRQERRVRNSALRPAALLWSPRLVCIQPHDTSLRASRDNKHTHTHTHTPAHRWQPSGRAACGCRTLPASAAVGARRRSHVRRWRACRATLRSSEPWPLPQAPQKPWACARRETLNCTASAAHTPMDAVRPALHCAVHLQGAHAGQRARDRPAGVSERRGHAPGGRCHPLPRGTDLLTRSQPPVG